MKLKVYLATIDMKLKDFSKILQVDHRYMSQIMNGHVKPGKRLAKDILDLTEGQVSYLETKPEEPAGIEKK